MALTDSSRYYETPVTDLSELLADFEHHFENRGYSVVTATSSSGAFISLTKGGIFKTIIGMKTALNIDIELTGSGIRVKMQVGAFGRQILPTAIALLGTWLILLPQTVGLIEQNKLDKEAYEVIESSLRRGGGIKVVDASFNICPSCGKKNPASGLFCTACGTSLKKEEICCSKCGKPLPAGSQFCMFCGEKQ